MNTTARIRRALGALLVTAAIAAPAVSLNNAPTASAHAAMKCMPCTAYITTWVNNYKGISLGTQGKNFTAGDTVRLYYYDSTTHITLAMHQVTANAVGYFSDSLGFTNWCDFDKLAVYAWDMQTGTWAGIVTNIVLGCGQTA